MPAKNASSACVLGLRTAIRAPSKKSARCSPSRVSAFARLRPRRCANCATHRAPATSARFSKVFCDAFSSIQILPTSISTPHFGRSKMKNQIARQAALAVLLLWKMPSDDAAAKAIAGLDGKELGGAQPQGQRSEDQGVSRDGFSASALLLARSPPHAHTPQ